MRPEAEKGIRVKSALSRTGGTLASFTHSLQPYIGCSFGHGCGVYCYVPFLPIHRYRSEGYAWGDYVWYKENVATLLRDELRRFAHRSALDTLRIFMSSATDPYQPAEGKLRLARACLQALVDYPPGLLVVQTRSPIVVDDFDLLRQLGPRAWLSMTVETDDEAVRRTLTPGVPSIRRRKETVETAAATGIQTQVTVAPFLALRAPERFAAWLDAHAERVLVDTFTSGDGGRGGRTARSRLPAAYREAGLGNWQDEAAAIAFHDLLVQRLGSARVGWSSTGFNALPSVGSSPAEMPQQPSLFSERATPAGNVRDDDE
ncbi:MAG: hypothetical protein R3272_04020 [Candidatus Promineifilaceae bacterium]|nr:hypothetical protein [Candidatus Promineifilaceae bacterium]